MYSYIKGTLEITGTDHIVIEAQDIGYLVYCTQRDLADLSLQQGELVQIHTEFIVREDSMTLYGFLSPQTRELFQLLIQTNGIGPKLAMGILSQMDGDSLIKAILLNDLIPLTQLSGIGKKTAERMVIDLKDKVQKLSGGLDIDTRSPTTQLDATQEREIRQALSSLGYSNTEIKEMTQSIRHEIKPDSRLEDILKLALRTPT